MTIVAVKLSVAGADASDVAEMCLCLFVMFPGCFKSNTATILGGSGRAGASFRRGTRQRALAA